MKGEDPSPSGANTHWGAPGDLDTAPVFTTREHLDYLVELIAEEWRKTMVKYDNVSAMGHILSPVLDKLEHFDPEEDTVTRVDASTVPQLVTAKLEELRQWNRNGSPQLTNLMNLVKWDLEKYRPAGPIASEEVEGGSDKAAIFADMLIELAKYRMLEEIHPKKETEKTAFDLKVVFVDQSGTVLPRSFRFQQDTDFGSFLELMDDYPQEYDLNVNWAASCWDRTVQKFKEKGYGDDPKLGEIEQRIASFKATNYYAVPKWMFYKTNRRISYAKPIEGERDIQMILEILANPANDSRLACMVRAVDKDIILILDELRSFCRRIEDNVSPGNEPVAPSAPDDQGNQGD